MTKKIRADSILGTLPANRQAEIAEFALAHSLEGTRQWLAADGLRLDRSTISRWLSSWCLRQSFLAAESSAAEFRDWLAKKFPALSAAQLDERASVMFQAEAMKSGDPETYLAFATARHKAEMDKLKFGQRERALNLDREKFELDAAEKMLSSALRAKADEINASALSQADKIAAMRREAFKSVDELQASGKVKIPKA